MLNGISKLLIGEVLKVLSDMGHGDVLILADANFPGETCAKTTTYGSLIRLPKVNVTELYDALAPLFPLDVDYSEKPIAIMDLTQSDKERGMNRPVSWKTYEEVLHKTYKDAELGLIERQEFYKVAKQSYAIIQTGEERQYGNLLLVKGCIMK